MAVQKSRKSKAGSKHRRAGATNNLIRPQITTDPMTGEKVRRHHVTKSGFYKGKSIIKQETTVAEVDA